MAFQWGFGNDVLLPPLAAWTLDAVDDGQSWDSGVAAAAATGAVALLFWGSSQLLDAVIVMSGLALVPGLTERISRYIRDRGWATPYADMRWSTRWIMAYAAGVSLLCLVDVLATGRRGLRERWTMIAVSAAVSAGSVASVVVAISAAALVGRRVPSTEQAANLFIRYAKNPLVWIAIFGAVYAFERFRARSEDSSTEVD